MPGLQHPGIFINQNRGKRNWPLGSLFTGLLNSPGRFPRLFFGTIREAIGFTCGDALLFCLFFFPKIAEPIDESTLRTINRKSSHRNTPEHKREDKEYDHEFTHGARPSRS